MKLAAGEEQAIRARMKELATQRAEKQPLEYPSAGSTFKRPEGYFAGKLIQDAGLKGFSVGDAQVSEMLYRVVRRRVERGEDLSEVLKDYPRLTAEQRAEIVRALSGR